jgi:hypothetical protein
MKVRIASNKPKSEVVEKVIEAKPKVEEVPTIDNNVKVEPAKAANWHDAAVALAKEFVQNDKIV